MWGVSLTHPLLASFLSGEFLLHIPCWLHFYLGSFSYTSHAGFIFIWGVSLTHPVLALLFMWGVSLTHPLSGKFLVHITCWLYLHLGSFSYISHAGFIFIWGVSLTHPMLVSFLYGEFLLHIPWSLHFYLGSFSYTSHAGFLLMWGVSTQLCIICIWGVSLTHPVMALFVSGEFPLHIPCWLQFYLWSFSYTSHTGFIFLWAVFLISGVSHTSRSGLPFYVGSFSYTSLLVSSFIRGISLLHSMLASFFFFSWGVSLTHPVLVRFFIRGVSLTHPMLVSFLFGEFLLHIPCWFHFFNLGSFSDTSRSGLPFHVGRFSYTSLPDFICIWGVSLTHPTLASFLSGEFLLHIPCWFHFHLGSFSYTSHAGFIFIWGVSLTHPMLV